MCTQALAIAGPHTVSAVRKDETLTYHLLVTSYHLILLATPSAAGPFWLLGVVIWGARCLHFDILGDHFSIPRAPWGHTLALRDRPGGPWDRQDGHKVVRKRICIDFGLILGRVYVSFCVQES